MSMLSNPTLQVLSFFCQRKANLWVKCYLKIIKLASFKKENSKISQYLRD